MAGTAERWAASGAMALTGDRAGPPLVAPPDVVERIEEVGHRAGVDALAMLSERAVIAGFGRRGQTSCGGGSRLLRVADGWIAVTLARADDIELVPAWLELDAVPLDEWTVIEAAVASRSAGEVVERGRLLGLPVAVVGEVTETTDPVRASRIAADGDRGKPPVVVDLSSLWAGPLCARILGDHGMRVVKVESATRPDGARRGPPAFFELLHAGHESVVLDFSSPALHHLLAEADVVIEASRPRALQQLGIDVATVLAERPTVWVSITGYGRDSNGVAFGDDAAAAGGLVAWGSDGEPRFVADAVADPLTGIAAAGAVLAALQQGGSWLLDVAMARVAAWVAGPTPSPWLP